MKLQYKIMLFTFVILSLIISSIGMLSYQQMQKSLKDQLGKNVMDIAEVIAAMDVVKTNIDTHNGYLKIQRVVEGIRLKTRVQYIVVMDMDGIRYSHPIPEQIGEKFVGGDEKQVLSMGDSYISEGIGTLGPSLRAFVPIYREGEQVGAVAVGILLGRVSQEVYSIMAKFFPVLILGLILGGIGAVILSYNIKKTIFGLEPSEIARLASEKEAVLQSVKEAIVAVNQAGEITLFNQTARRLLELTDYDLGKTLNEFRLESYITEVLKSGQPLYNLEKKIKPGLTVLCNYHPLCNEAKQIIGVVISFQDLTDIKRMAEELTGIKNGLALRAQNHEFLNKLHTISGLIQLGEYSQAIQFISQTAKTRQDILGILTHQIKEPTLAGLLLAKYNKAAEARVTFEIDENSYLDDLPLDMTTDEIGSILGNLIENALEAVVEQGDGHIWIKIYEELEILKLEVKDNGPGIPVDIRDKIYQRGVTTKDEANAPARGYGLAIVKEIVSQVGGEIEFNIDEGTEWIISLPL